MVLLCQCVCCGVTAHASPSLRYRKDRDQLVEALRGSEIGREEDKHTESLVMARRIIAAYGSRYGLKNAKDLLHFSDERQGTHAYHMPKPVLISLSPARA